MIEVKVKDIPGIDKRTGSISITISFILSSNSSILEE
ncbi:hypothetical protein JOD41_001509 [Peptoniphilus gorbachii]|uniref:Uncharacterized protein n=1 Tax=Peptoniphilus gorbachii TaxID=411567 RepID=A0ABS2ML69_9FIRM|nr:hypothetical protein [Peptoniphilus gorbachii]